MDFSIEKRQFAEINLSDAFFDSLKAAYSEFVDWYTRKASEGAEAYVMHVNGNVEAFLYLKQEIGVIDDIEPNLTAKNRIKVGTFKINAHGTKLGQRFVKIIFDHSIAIGAEEIYVTAFEEHIGLIALLRKYGFDHIATKETHNGQELVLLKDLNLITGELNHDYPKINIKGNSKWLLGIAPEYHSRLLPDSILNNESYNILEDVSYTNSIDKIYVCYMAGVASFRPGDTIVVYRLSDKQGPARYRSVITSVGVVQEVKTKSSFIDLESYLRYCQANSIFNREELTAWYHRRSRNPMSVVKFTYNAALSKRVTRGSLIDDVGLNEGDYWGVMQLTDNQFIQMLELGEVNQNILVN